MKKISRRSFLTAAAACGAAAALSACGGSSASSTAASSTAGSTAKINLFDVVILTEKYNVFKLKNMIK